MNSMPGSIFLLGADRKGFDMVPYYMDFLIYFYKKGDPNKHSTVISAHTKSEALQAVLDRKEVHHAWVACRSLI